MSGADRQTCDVLTLAGAIIAAEVSGLVIVRIVGVSPVATLAVAGGVLFAAFAVAAGLLRSRPASAAIEPAGVTPVPATERSPRRR